MVNHPHPQRISTSLHRAAIAACLLTGFCFAAPALADKNDPAGGPPGGGPGKHSNIQWVNHFDLLPGCAEVATSYHSTSSGVGGGLTGLVIRTSTLGASCADNGNKVVQMALELHPHTKIRGVRLCYELTSAATYITQIRLAQVQDPPAVATVMLDDATPLTATGPVCVDSAKTAVDSANGSVLLSLRVNGGDPAVSDAIVVRALGLYVDD